MQSAIPPTPARVISLAIALLSLPQVARAEDDRVRAARFFSAGQQAYIKGDYLTAVRAFEESQQAKPHPSTLFNLAQALRRQFDRDRDLRKARRAVGLYRRAIRQFPGASWRPSADAELLQLLAELARQPAPATQPALKEPPPPTQLMVTSQTPQARVSLGTSVGIAEPAPAIYTVAAGSHRVHVTAPGYMPETRSVVAVAHRLVVASVDLQPLPGAIRVLANVAGATVHLDGRAAGQTPFEQTSVIPGKHDLAVTHRGHASWQESVTVRSGQVTLSVASLSWSTQRRVAVVGAGASLALAAAGMVTGLLALQADASLDGMPVVTNAERVARDDRLSQRDALGLSSTVLLSTAAVGLVTSALLYLFDPPPAPVATRSAPVASRGPAEREL